MLRRITGNALRDGIRSDGEIRRKCSVENIGDYLV